MKCTLPSGGRSCGKPAVARYQIRDTDGSRHEIYRCLQHDPAACNLFAARVAGLETREALS
jgi:hypothetical protein